MDLRRDILKQIKWILKNQQKYYLWVPLTALAAGGIIAFVHHYLNSVPKYVVKEPCSVCYSNNRSIIVEPCHHLVLC